MVVRHVQDGKIFVRHALKPKNVSSALGDMIDFGALMAQLA